MSTVKQKRLLCLLLIIQFCLVAGYAYYQKHYWSKDILRVVYLDSNRVEANLSPYGPGFEKELVQYFCSMHGLKPEWIEVNSLERGIGMLQSGKANLLIADAHDSEQSWDSIVRGPEYMSSRMIIAHNQWRYPLNSINDLCSVPVVVPDRNLFSQKIQRLESDLGCPIDVVHSGGSGEDFFKLVSNREFRFGLVDELSFDLWHCFFPQVYQTYNFETSYGHAWLWSARFRDLDRKLSWFWNKMPDDPYLAVLKDKYFGFFPSEKDSYQLRHFIRTIEAELPRYIDVIKEASQMHDIDPLLLTAIIYQESHFDPDARSRTGVQGLMQITRDTAEFIGIQDRLDPDQSILGGAMYLDYLVKRVEARGASSWDKWFMVLAAYNQGLGHLHSAMELAERKEGNRLSWHQLKQTYPLLSYRKYYETLPAGYARGFEAVNFTENIRYYYYILYSLISLSRPEVEHLAGLLDFVPRRWPD